MKHGRNRRIILGIICSGMILTAAVGGTFALLKARSIQASNMFQGAIVNVAVKEDGTVYETGTNDTWDKITSGEWVDKRVQVINKNTDKDGNPLDTLDTYVRVRLVPVFRDANGSSVPADMSLIEYEMADDHWVAKTVGGEKYYYYTNALTPGQSSGNLICKVKYNGEIPEGTTLQLQVLTEGVAAKQQSTYDSAWK